MNNEDVSQTNSQKHLGVILDFKSAFHDHLDTIYTKVRKTIGLLRKLNSILPRAALVMRYKAFAQPHVEYGDALYDQAFDIAFHDNLRSIQDNVCLAITGAIRGTSRDKLCQESSLESLQLRRWYRKLFCFTAY